MESPMANKPKPPPKPNPRPPDDWMVKTGSGQNRETK